MQQLEPLTCLSACTPVQWHTRGTRAGGGPGMYNKIDEAMGGERESKHKQKDSRERDWNAVERTNLTY